MASFDSVHQKMYRARDHYIELREQLVKYYSSEPIEFIQGIDSSSEKPNVILREKVPLPKRFGLIFGDCIQCQRSCLDYLVHELVGANNHSHHMQNQFPIAISLKAYRNKLRGHYLDGVDPKAVAVIKGLQPFRSADPANHPLVKLDRLANINKHRRVLLTNFVSTNVPPLEPLAFPHIRGEGKIYSLLNGRSFVAPVWGYVTIKDETMQDVEITTGIETLSEYLITKVFPLFERFF